MLLCLDGCEADGLHLNFRVSGLICVLGFGGRFCAGWFFEASSTS